MRSTCVLGVKHSYNSKKIGRTVGFGDLEMKRRSGVCYVVDTFDSFVERALLGDILDDDELKSVTVLREFIVEEGGFGQ